MNRVLIALGIALIVLPLVVMATVMRLSPEVGLDTMNDDAFLQTKTYAYAVYASIVILTGIVCTIVGAISLAHECHSDNVRQYCGSSHESD